MSKRQHSGRIAQDPRTGGTSHEVSSGVASRRTGRITIVKPIRRRVIDFVRAKTQRSSIPQRRNGSRYGAPTTGTWWSDAWCFTGRSAGSPAARFLDSAVISVSAFIRLRRQAASQTVGLACLKTFFIIISNSLTTANQRSSRQRGQSAARMRKFKFSSVKLGSLIFFFFLII